MTSTLPSSSDKRVVDPSSRSESATQPRSDQEQRVWDALEQARQKVKRLVKEELEGEVVPSDLLSFRLKSHQ